MRKRGGHDEKKLAALLTGDYMRHHPELTPVEREKLQVINYAVAHPETIVWANTGAAGGGTIHGEMALLDLIAAQMPVGPPAPGAALQDWPVSGRKRDCLACHWAHDFFNTYIANPRGYRVVTSGSHGRIFPGWKMPPWMAGKAEARAAMEGAVTENKVQLQRQPCHQ